MDEEKEGKIRGFPRFWKINSVLIKSGLFPYFYKMPFNSMGFKLKLKKGISLEEIGIRLRKLFEELGPTYIKFGQILSVQYGKIPEEIRRELEKLQDSVPGFEYETAERIIEEDFGKKINSLFWSFDKEPIASASLSQVHKAVLHNKDEVAVKIQRPGIRKTIKEDLKVIRFFAKFMKNFFEKNDIDIFKVIEEFEGIIIRELEFDKEGKNMEKIREITKNLKDVKIPRVYEELTSKRVITMEFIDGVKITDAGSFRKEGFNKKTVIRNLLNAELSMIFDYGLYHGDPHPANIFVMEGNKIAFLDFGIVGYLDKKTREIALENMDYMLRQDALSLIRNYAKLNHKSLSELDNIKDIEREVNKIFEAYMKSEIESFGDCFFRITEIFNKYGFTKEDPFVILLRTIVILNSVFFKLGIKEEDYLEAIMEVTERIRTKKISNVFTRENIEKNFIHISELIGKNIENNEFSPKKLEESFVNFNNFVEERAENFRNGVYPKLISEEKRKIEDMERDIERINKTHSRQIKGFFSLIILALAFFMLRRYDLESLWSNIILSLAGLFIIIYAFFIKK